MRLKKCFSMLCAICLAICTMLSTASAYVDPTTSIPTPQSVNSIDGDTAEPQDLYTTGWRLKSCTKVSNAVYLSYRNGPSGYGPATLSINQGTSLNRSVSNTLSGSYSWGAESISLSTGYSFGKTESHSTSYSITIPSGKHRMIIYRPVMRKYKIVTEYVRMPTSGYGSTTVLKTETAYGLLFDHWDYNWKNV